VLLIKVECTDGIKQSDTIVAFAWRDWGM